MKEGERKFEYKQNLSHNCHRKDKKGAKITVVPCRSSMNETTEGPKMKNKLILHRVVSVTRLVCVKLMLKKKAKKLFN